MQELVAHLIAGFFLLLIVIECGRFLFKDYGFSRGWIRVPAPTFIALSCIVAAMTFFFLLFLTPEDVLIGIALGAGITLSFLHPVVAVVFFIANLLGRPWELFESNFLMNILPRLLAVVALISWIVGRFQRRKMPFVWTRGLTVFSLMFLWFIISTQISPNSDDNLSDLFKPFFPVYVVCYLLVTFIDTPAALSLLKRVIGLAITSIISIAMVVTVGDPLFHEKALRLEGIGLAGNSNDLAALAVMAIPFLLVPTIDRLKKKTIKFIDLICLSILGLGLLLTQSRAGVGALAGVFLLYLFLVSKSRWKLMGWLTLTLPAVVVLAMKVTSQRDASDLEGSSDSRMGYILAGLKMLRANPLFGVGVGNYPKFYDKYAVTFLEGGLRTAHSTWMLIAAEAGPIGLVLFSVLFFNAVKKAWKMRQSSPELIMAIIGYGIPMSVLSHSYTLFPYLMIFLVTAAYRAEMKKI